MDPSTSRKREAESTEDSGSPKKSAPNEVPLEEKKVDLEGIKNIVQLHAILPANLDEWSAEALTSALEKTLGFFGTVNLKERPRVGEVEAEQEVLLKQIDALEERKDANEKLLADKTPSD